MNEREDGIMDYNMRIYSYDGSSHGRSEISDPDYPVNIYYYDRKKIRSSPIQWHWHSEIEILYVDSGEIVLSTNNGEHVCRAGSGIAVKGNAIHNIVDRENESGSFYSIVFAPEFVVGKEGGILWNKYWLQFLDSPVQVIDIDSSVPWMKDALRYITLLIKTSQTREHGYEFAVKASLCNFMAELSSHLTLPDRKTSRVDRSDDIRVKTALMYIRLHYSENITLDEIAESASISKSECCRSFKRTLHQTPFEYLMKYRIYSAAKRLGDRSVSEDTAIADLALESGFNNISYFNKLFRKYMGCTPTKYRRDMIDKGEEDDLEYLNFTM